MHWADVVLSDFFKLVTCKQYYLRRDPIVSLFPLRAIFLLNGKSSTILAQWFIFFKQHLAVALYIHVDIYQKQLCFLYEDFFFVP